MSELNGLNKKRVILIDEASGNIDYQSNADSLTSMLIWKDENKRRSQLKKTNALLVERYGEKVTMFQNALLRVAKELSPIENRVFLVLFGVCDYENFIRVPQKEIATELNEYIPNVSSALKSLEKKRFIEVYKHGRQSYYRINPELGWKGTYENWKKEIDLKEFKERKEKEAKRIADFREEYKTELEELEKK